MTPAATPEALAEALALEIADILLDGGALSPKDFAHRIASGPALQRVTAEKDAEKARADRIDAKLGELNAAVREHLPPIDTLIAEREAAEAALATATAEAASLRAEVEAMKGARDDALKAAIRAWSAKLHIPVTRMMSRELRAEFSAALARAATAREGQAG